MIRALSAALSWANAVRPQNSCLRCPTILESRLKKYLHLINLQNQCREEKYFILLLIQGAISYGETLCEIDGKLNEFISCGTLPEEYQEKKQIEETAGALSKELLYMKFLQGIPVVGAVGGAYDAIYMKRITEYAGLKYRHRYLDAQNK